MFSLKYIGALAISFEFALSILYLTNLTYDLISDCPQRLRLKHLQNILHVLYIYTHQYLATSAYTNQGHSYICWYQDTALDVSA